MEFTNIAPRWDAAGVEPTTELQEKGFQAGYKPPAAYFNYLFNRYTACITEAQVLINELETAYQEIIVDILALKNTVGDYTGGGEKNLLQYETIINDTDYGTYCTVSTDGCITIANTTSDSINPETEKQLLSAGTYTLSVTSDVAGVRCYLMRGDTVAGQFFTTVGTQTLTYTYDRELNHKLQFVVPAGITANLYAQLEEGETATAFESHVLSVADALNKFQEDYVAKKDIVDNLLSTSTVLPLSANQGRVLNEKLGGLSIVPIAEADYTALATKDSNTLYFVY